MRRDEVGLGGVGWDKIQYIYMIRYVRDVLYVLSRLTPGTIWNLNCVVIISDCKHLFR